MHTAEDDETVKMIAKVHGLGVKAILDLNKKRKGMRSLNANAELKEGTQAPKLDRLFSSLCLSVIYLDLDLDLDPV